MNISAYCRVSTDKEEQLNSLEKRKEFQRMLAESVIGLWKCLSYDRNIQ